MEALSPFVYRFNVDEMSDLLIKDPNKMVKVIFKLKDGKVKSFEIDSDSLADAYRDDRFRAMEAARWGMYDKSAMNAVFDSPDSQR